ncbi:MULTISPECIES: hypothetical protein [Brasilonema]|uniref:hypothetical protein n=1 Tax=Brasilonema TaxID=383614 RepID=UPI001FE3F93D|nr:hypothetical protein [Brasilonema sennae]
METIKGTSGNDNLNYSVRKDDLLIYGLQGNDTITGGSGDDTLAGEFGDDILTGGAGRDIFELYYSGGGIDRITDFKPGEDLIVVRTAPHNSKDDNDNYQRLLSVTKDVLNEGVAINSTQFTTPPLNIGSSKSVVQVNNGSLTYHTDTGALFYDTQQIALLAPKLGWGDITSSIVTTTSPV